MTNWENMTPEDEQRIVDNASKLKGFFSPIRAAYGIPENVPIIEELDRRFERMEATIKELENKNIALEFFAKGATAIGGDQIERIKALEEAFRRYAIHDETCDQEIYGAEACNCGYREVLLSLKP